MFIPKTEKIEQIEEIFPNRIEELESIFDKPTNIYIDYANIFSWHSKLHFHIDWKRFFQFFKSFSSVENIYFYNWTLNWDKDSENLIKFVKKIWYNVSTKQVKIMKKSIDVRNIDIKTNTSILEQFIKRSLLKQFNIEVIEYLNNYLLKLNNIWIYFIEDKKCNFDVEIWNQMLEDMSKNEIKNFVLLSGDSDFTTIINQITNLWNKSHIFSTAWRISKELSLSKWIIYDLKKIRDFICRNSEITEKAKEILI